MITNTWVLNYLSGAERTAYVAALDELGSRLDLSWVFAESPVLVPELPVADRTQAQTALVLVRWRGGPAHRRPTSATPTPTATGCTGADRPSRPGTLGSRVDR